MEDFTFQTLSQPCYKGKMYPTNIYLFKINNRNTRKSCEIFSKKQ